MRATVQNVQTAARLQSISDLLAAERRVVDVVDIANRLGVAQETIRRDLRTMESAGAPSQAAPQPFVELGITISVGGTS